MSGELREMSAERVGEWLPGMWAGYRASIVAAGYSAETADANVARNRAALTSGEGLTEGNHVFDVLVEGRPVGVVWIGRASGESESEYYVYDVEVDEAERGRGYGRVAMELVEAWVRAAGGTTPGRWPDGRGSTGGCRSLGDQRLHQAARRGRQGRFRDGLSAPRDVHGRGRGRSQSLRGGLGPHRAQRGWPLGVGQAAARSGIRRGAQGGVGQGAAWRVPRTGVSLDLIAKDLRESHVWPASQAGQGGVAWCEVGSA